MCRCSPCTVPVTGPLSQPFASTDLSRAWGAIQSSSVLFMYMRGAGAARLHFFGVAEGLLVLRESCELEDEELELEELDERVRRLFFHPGRDAWVGRD